MATTKLFKNNDVMEVPEFDKDHWTGQGWTGGHIGSTNWGQLQKDYTPHQLQQSTKKVGQDIFWNPDVKITDIPSVPNVPTQSTPDEIGSDMGKGMPEPDTYGGDADALMASAEAAMKPTQDAVKEIIKLQQQPLQSQQEFDEIRQREAAAGEEFKTAGTDMREDMWARFGMDQNVEQLQALLPQMAAMQAESARMQQELAETPGRSRIIGGTQDRLARQTATEMAGLSAMAQAYQGNIDMARTLTQDAINAKYKDQEYYINNLRQQMNYIKDNLNREEAIKLDNLTTVINERERNIADAKELEVNLSNLMVNSAELGAPQNVLQQIMDAETFQEAVILAQPYLKPRPDGLLDNGDGTFTDLGSGTRITPDQFGSSVIIPESSRIAYVHNNPGNLMYANQEGATKGEPKAGGGHWAYFESPEAGYEALKRQVELDASRGLTIEQFVSKYAPPSENDTELYIQQLTQDLKVPRNTPISKIDTDVLAQFMAKKESGTGIRNVTETPEGEDDIIIKLTPIEQKNLNDVAEVAPLILSFPAETQLTVLRNLSNNIDRANFLRWFEENKMTTGEAGLEQSSRFVYPTIDDIAEYKGRTDTTETSSTINVDEFLNTPTTTKEKKGFWSWLGF